MFGYIVPDLSSLNEVQRLRYRSVYCGLCRTLRDRYGLAGTLTLSNDLTFLALLLNSLYEPDETCGTERCLAHPFKSHSYVTSKPFEYAADMNIALAYHKCIDNWMDDHSILSRGEAAVLKRSYVSVASRYPVQCTAIETWLKEIHNIEASDSADIDAPVNSTGRVLGTIFCWKNDYWSAALKNVGDGLGRFIYMMDAYEDLPDDIRRNRFNPLKSYHKNEDFEQMCKDSLLMMVADCTLEFEKLPLVQDIDILRNILYSGIWGKYGKIQKKREADSKGET